MVSPRAPAGEGSSIEAKVKGQADATAAFAPRLPPGRSRHGGDRIRRRGDAPRRDSRQRGRFRRLPIPKQQVQEAAQIGVQTAWKTCNAPNLLPATQNCTTSNGAAANLSAALTSAIQSTSLGTRAALASGYPAEGYYCVNASGALQSVGSLSSKPTDCSGRRRGRVARRLCPDRRDGGLFADLSGLLGHWSSGRVLDFSDKLDAAGIDDDHRTHAPFPCLQSGGDGGRIRPRHASVPRARPWRPFRLRSLIFDCQSAGRG